MKTFSLLQRIRRKVVGEPPFLVAEQKKGEGQGKYVTFSTMLHKEAGESLEKYVCCLQSVYYESRKRKLKTRLIYEYRCDERLKN